MVRPSELLTDQHGPQPPSANSDAMHSDTRIKPVSRCNHSVPNDVIYGHDHIHTHQTHAGARSVCRMTGSLVSGSRGTGGTPTFPHRTEKEGQILEGIVKCTLWGNNKTAVIREIFLFSATVAVRC